MSSNERYSRRDLLAAIAAGSVTLATSPAWARFRPAGSTPIEHGATEGADATATGPLATAFANIAPGMGVYGGWSIATVALVSGAVVLNLHHEENPAQRCRLDICRRDPSGPPGVEETRFFAVFAMNEGAGSQRTEATQHRAIRVIAEVLRRQETDLSQAPSELHSHRERVALIERGELHFGRA